MIQFRTKGVCAKEISFEIKDNVIRNVKFIGGCPGNVIAVATLVEGMTVEEAIRRLKGIKCGDKSTSCPDQLARAIEESLKQA